LKITIAKKKKEFTGNGNNEENAVRAWAFETMESLKSSGPLNGDKRREKESFYSLPAIASN
jgi:hypothetical protein